MIRVLFFGRLRDTAGRAEMDCAPPADIATIAGLRAWLGAQDDALGTALAAPGIRVARDQSFCGFDAALAGAREIAFMAPLSGG